MNESRGYWALLSNPQSIRYWDGVNWQGDVLLNADATIVGFTDSLEAIPLQVVQQVGKGDPEPSFVKFCSTCNGAVNLESRICPTCGGGAFGWQKFEGDAFEFQGFLRTHSEDNSLETTEEDIPDRHQNLTAESSDELSQVALPQEYLNVISHFLKALWYLVISSVIGAIGALLVNNEHQGYLRCYEKADMYSASYCVDASIVFLLLFSPAALIFLLLALWSGSVAVSRLRKLQK